MAEIILEEAAKSIMRNCGYRQPAKNNGDLPYCQLLVDCGNITIVCPYISKSANFCDVIRLNGNILMKLNENTG